MNALLARHGLHLPTPDETMLAAVAGGITLAALALGLLAGRIAGPRLGAWWRGHVSAQPGGLGDRMRPLVRHGLSALLLAIALQGYAWPGYAPLPLGLALGFAAGMGTSQLLRGLGIPRWLAWGVALVLFVALLSNSVGGLDRIAATLELVGFNIGRRRFSLLRLIVMAVTVIVLFAAVRLANRIIGHTLSRTPALDAAQQVLAQKLAGVASVVVAFFIGIDLLGIDLTALTVFTGAFGLAVGFGLQRTVGNLIAGIILLMDRSIKPGDVIVVGDKEVGWVSKIGVRAVSVLTRDGKEHLIPNENLMTQAVENWSYSNREVRVRIPVGVAYDSDLKLAQALMLQAASESPRVLADPPPNVWLTAFGDSAVEHEILAWISDPEGGVGNVRSDVLNRLWELFGEHGIEIPFPQRELRWRGAPPPA